MPVRSLKESVLRWPDPDQVMRAPRHWAQRQAEEPPALIALGVHGLHRERLLQRPLVLFPLTCDAVILIPEERRALLVPA